MNFRQLDLNLLRVLAAIHRTRSVTAAGRALSLSQSATPGATTPPKRSCSFRKARWRSSL